MGAALAALLAPVLAIAAVSPDETARWRDEASHVSIVRDDWGLAHVHGHTDADAVFGMIYAQAEDDFGRVEANYLTSIGWMAKARGEDAVWQDLRQRLFLDPDDLKTKYEASPPWLKALMNAWADGLNYYLATHPNVHPLAIARFEPWMPLAFSEGSIGGDIERVDLADLQRFYGPQIGQPNPKPQEVAQANLKPPSPSGSNGIAIAPKNTRDGHALLLINPHTSFFFRSELQMSSDEGLNAYGAVTWGQFFIYQGFNPHAGWMHTSSGVDNVDRFAETIRQPASARAGPGPTYVYGAGERPVGVSRVAIDYRKADGAMGQHVFTIYRTQHGPVIAAKDGKWITMALMNRPVPALEQSFLRTRTSDLASYMKVAALQANSSNNTLFADDKGEIAYLHPQFVPIRNDRFDYTHIVDGSDPATDWQGLTPVEALPSTVDPAGGFVFNTNDWPYSAAGAWSPRRQDFPRYMDTAGENPRGIHALRLLEGRKDFTLEGLMHSAYDSWLPAFDTLLPPLFAAYDGLAGDDPLRHRLAGPVAALRGWDHRWGAASVPTTLASFWGDALGERARADVDEDSITLIDRMQKVSPRAKLDALAVAVDRLDRQFGTWRTPWGEVNRFQRISDQIVPQLATQTFDDKAPSIPVPFTTSRWGSLAAFEAKPWGGTTKWYGVAGNSFVAVVEFAGRVRARAVTAGGESGRPGDRHFDDEAQRYAEGNLREVYFWPDELAGHTERTYRPGE
jgi:acyl-homoserine-lactone acylase